MKKLLVSALVLPAAVLFALAGCAEPESTESEGEEEEELDVDAPEADAEALYKCCFRLPSGVCKLKVEAHRPCP
jgi:hypothetical protein